MMSLTFGLFTQVSGSGPLGPLVLVIAMAVLRCSHKSLRTDKGAEYPTEPKLPDFTLYLV